MAEYIEREAAQKVAERYGCTSGATLGRHSGLADCIASEIEALPAADVAPVRHGNWDSSGKYMFVNGDLAVRCSECGCSLRQEEYEKFYWNYCPVCGARMDGGDPDA